MSIDIKTIASNEEEVRRNAFLQLYLENPIPSREMLANIGLFSKRQELTKVLFFDRLYQQILDVHGVVMEFGVRWGQNLVTLTNLRGIYEPYNYSRKIIGFDTFSGFTQIHQRDGEHPVLKEGAFSVTEDYSAYLDSILKYHESESPLSHIKKNFLIKGDASVTLNQYLTEHPETIIAFAYFDFDIYEPTFKCLQIIKDHVTKGTIIGFDELNDPHFPGETIALKEAWGLSNISLQRYNFCGIQSYFKVG